MAIDVEKLIQEFRSLSPNDQGRVRQAFAAGLQADEQHPSNESREAEYQEQLLKAGLLKSIKLRVRDQAAFDRFQPVAIIGKPLSETIIEARR